MSDNLIILHMPEPEHLTSAQNVSGTAMTYNYSHNLEALHRRPALALLSPVSVVQAWNW